MLPKAISSMNHKLQVLNKFLTSHQMSSAQNKTPDRNLWKISKLKITSRTEGHLKLIVNVQLFIIFFH